MQKDASFDGDDVHQATSIHARQNLQAYLQKFDTDSISVLKQNEFDNLSRNADNLDRVQEKIELIDSSIPQPEGVVNPETENNIPEVGKASISTAKAVREKQKAIDKPQNGAER